MNLNPWNWKSWIRICRMETHYLYLVYIYANWRTFLIFVWQSTSVFCIQRKGHLNLKFTKTLIFKNSNENIGRLSALNIFIDMIWQFTLFKPGEGGQITTQRISAFLTPGFKKLSIRNFRAKILTEFLLPFWKINVFISSFWV